MCEGEAQTRSDAYRAAGAALARIGQLGFDGLDDETLRAEVRDLRGFADQVELLGVKALAALDRTGGYRAEGATDLTSWMVASLDVSPEAAQDRVIVARSLETLPATVDLLAHREINFEQATVVARSASKVRPENAPRVEGMILARALSTDAGSLRRHAAAAVAEVDAEVLSRDAWRAREKRSFNIGPDVDGSARVSGDVTSELAAALRARMEPFTAPTGAGDARTAAQRRHDALLEALSRGGGERRPRQLVVVAPLSAMRGEDGPPAMLQGLFPLTREELQEIACDTALSVVIKGAKGNILAAGKSARTFSWAKRRAMLAQHPTCAFKGCTRRATECDAHHLVEYSRGGETTMDVYVPLCRLHHAMVHREGWAVVPCADGTFRTLPPGHPENPGSRLTPEEYLRRRDVAVARRKKTGEPRVPLPGAEATRAGP